MGDAADDLIDRMDDPYCEDDGSPIEVYCKYCKRPGFHWEETPCGWRLHTRTGEVHKCSAYKPVDHE